LPGFLLPAPGFKAGKKDLPDRRLCPEALQIADIFSLPFRHISCSMQSGRRRFSPSRSLNLSAETATPMKKWIKNNFSLVQASPWITLLSVALLTLIIVVFAVNNLQREKKHMTETLIRKGQDTVRFIGAGTRAAAMMGYSLEQQLQRLLEEAGTDDEIAYIRITDENDRIIAHTDASLVGTVYKGEQPMPLSEKSRWKVLETKEGGEKIFEVQTAFLPFGRGNGPMPMRRHMMMRRLQERFSAEDNASPLRKRLLQRKDTHPLTIAVGLRTGQLASAIRQNYLQIVIMSVLLLLVGLGGWLALFVMQGYRVSQETLENMQLFTSLLISGLPAGIVATDPQNRINIWNRSMEELIGTSNRQAVGQSPSDVLPADLAGLLLQSPKIPATLNREMPFVDSRQEERVLQVSAIPVAGPQGEYKGSMLVLHDLTRQKDLERRVRRNERLAALGKMAAGVAHEVRNPLSSIKGFATLLGKRFAAGSEEAEAAGLLIREVERLNRSITELLLYARPLPLHKQPADLNELLTASLKLMEGDARETGIDIELRTGKDMPPVQLDRDRFSQVLLNLYLNALQAMEKGGRLTVETLRDRQGNRVLVTVSDTGCGIESQNLEKILDPYFTTKPEGTGLGLALAAKIIEEHGGTITFASEVGKGTRATVGLPLSSPEAK